MRFLLSWAVRLGLLGLVGAAMSASPFIAAGVWYVLLAYLVYCAWARLRVDIPRFWRATAFRKLPRSRGRFGLGRLRGDTL